MSDQTLEILTYVMLAVCAWAFWFVGTDEQPTTNKET